MEIQVQPITEKDVFLANIDGKEAYLQYRVLSPNSWEYVHTFVPKVLRGQGIAGTIIKYSLDYARQHHIKVTPTCPTVRKYLETHPEYDDVLID